MLFGRFHLIFALGLAFLLTYLPATPASAAAACTPSSSLCQLGVVIEQEDSTEASQYAGLLQMAPNIQQIHLRINPPGPGETFGPQSKNVLSVANRLIQIQTALKGVGASPQFGFHPDNDQTDADLQVNWSCSSSDTGWQCVFARSIQYMNAINAQVKLKGGVPFSIFSIEQSYIEPTDDASLLLQKQCLMGQPNSGCMLDDGRTTIGANPAVKFGNVLSGCGGLDLYGATTGYDYVYPQMYNIYRNNWIDTDQSIPSSLLPVPPSPTQTYSLLDAVATDKVSVFPNIVPASLSKNQSGDIQSIYQGIIIPGASGSGQAGSSPPPNPSVAGSIFSDIIEAKYPVSSAKEGPSGPYPCQIPATAGTAWLTLSGEPEFLGSFGWDQQNFNTLLSQIYSNFQTFYSAPQQTPTLMQTAVWSIDTMIGNLVPANPSQINFKQSLAFKTNVKKLRIKTGGAHAGYVKGHAGAIRCEGQCTLKVSGGTTLRLEAEPRKGYVFSSWKGPCHSTGKVCKVNMNRNYLVEAVFRAK